MIPLFYFPTNVILVDDDREFLNDLHVLLDGNIASYRLFNSPQKALNFLNQEASFLSDNNFFLENPESYEWGRQSFSLNFENIKNIALDPKRFDQVCIVIVDYNMPGMDGIELLQKINHDGIKKILLTGEADEHTAIEAFNDGIIKKYIRKQDPNLISKIRSAILECQREAFCDITSELILSKSPLHDNPIIRREPNLMTYFYQMLKEYNIVEFYLADNQGTLLLLDSKGNPSGFFVRTEDQIRVFEEEVLGEAEIPNDVKYAILNRDKLVCFLPQKGKCIPEDFELSKYVRSAKKISPRSNFYVAYLESFPFLADFKVESFQEYLNLKPSE